MLVKPLSLSKLLEIFSFKLQSSILCCEGLDGDELIVEEEEVEVTESASGSGEECYFKPIIYYSN